MEGIGRGRLFIGALKLLSLPNPNFSIAAIPESVPDWDSAHGVPEKSKTFWGAGYSPPLH